MLQRRTKPSSEGEVESQCNGRSSQRMTNNNRRKGLGSRQKIGWDPLTETLHREASDTPWTRYMSSVPKTDRGWHDNECLTTRSAVIHHQVLANKKKKKKETREERARGRRVEATSPRQRSRRWRGEVRIFREKGFRLEREENKLWPENLIPNQACIQIFTQIWINISKIWVNIWVKSGDALKEYTHQTQLHT